MATLERLIGDPFLAGVLLLAAGFAIIWLFKQILLRQRRTMWRQRWQRRHHEWWPSWTLYLPLVPVFIAFFWHSPPQLSRTICL